MGMFVDSEERAFVTSDGQKLYSLYDLYIWLNICSEEAFKAHANEKKNDFYLWIKDSLNLDDLAEEIKDIKDKEKFKSIIEKYIEEPERDIFDKETALVYFSKEYIK